MKKRIKILLVFLAILLVSIIIIICVRHNIKNNSIEGSQESNYSDKSDYRIPLESNDIVDIDTAGSDSSIVETTQAGDSITGQTDITSQSTDKPEDNQFTSPTTSSSPDSQTQTIDPYEGEKDYNF